MTLQPDIIAASCLLQLCIYTVATLPVGSLRPRRKTGVRRLYHARHGGGRPGGWSVVTEAQWTACACVGAAKLASETCSPLSITRKSTVSATSKPYVPPAVQSGLNMPLDAHALSSCVSHWNNQPTGALQQ